MTRIADGRGVVFGGVDTHAGVHVAAVTDRAGRVLGTASFPADSAGYAGLLAWLRRHGELAAAGVEGTGSYGAGLARYLAGQGVRVAEVNRPDRQRRRRRGKSDPVDAVSAAIAARNGEDTATPKAGDGAAESIRVLRVARRGAVKARTQAGNQLRDVVITAPAGLREQLAVLGTARLAAVAATFTCGNAADAAGGVKTAMASIARRWQALDAETASLDRALHALITAAAPPQLLARQGVATQTAAALITAAGDNPARITTEAGFAALCGVSPVDCSSGLQQHHRLNRGGDRQANSALWRIVTTRTQHDPETHAYVKRRTAEGKTPKHIKRSLKRYVARRVYKDLIRPGQSPAHPNATQVPRNLLT